jgi:PAS domain S-box-containing protein
VMDVTGRREAEVALRKTEEQYREIVEATTDGIVKVDAQGRIVFVNGRFAEMLGYAPQEMLGMSAFDLIPPEARSVAERSFQRRRHGGADAADTTVRHRNGTHIAVHVAGSPLVGSKGEYVGSLGVVRDMRERLKLQAQLMVSDRMASVGTLAAGVAHEINNPLTAVVMNLEYIGESLRRMSGGAAATPRSDAWLREEIQGPLDDAREAAQRVRIIVRDLKVFSRSPVDEPVESVDVKAIMESSLRMAWNEIRHRARLVKDYGEVPLVAASEARLGQVFLNLVVNAAQAVPVGTADDNEIRVRTRLEDERVLVEVSDTGVGIPPEAIGRIFDAFYTTKAVGVGTGLGLAICQRIVTGMGGELAVRSEPGVGTTFTVSLPIAREDPVGAPAPAAEPAVVGRRGHILLVDDEPSVLRILERLLAKDHEVVAVESAREALGLCVGGTTFDLILCDMMMPDMTGMDLHSELAKVLPKQAERMIFLTGGAFTTSARDFLSASDRKQIEKPFDSGNLRAIIQQHLRQLQ